MISLVDMGHSDNSGMLSLAVGQSNNSGTATLANVEQADNSGTDSLVDAEYQRDDETGIVLSSHSSKIIKGSEFSALNPPW